MEATVMSEATPMRPIRPRFAQLSLLSLCIAACNGPASPAPQRFVHLSIAPDSANLAAGDTLRFVASVTDVDGTPVGSMPLRWTTTDASVADVSSSGTVLGRGSGETSVFVEGGGAEAMATVAVHRDPLPPLMVVAHRGFMAIFPENTLVAVRGAFDRGADAVEVDVWLSSDGEPVVIHDGTVDRTTNGTGTVTNMTRSELRELDACSKRGSQWGSCPIPTAREVLREARGRGWVLLDLKGNWSRLDLQRLATVIREEDMRGSVVITRFDLAMLATLRAIDPRLGLGYMSRDVPSEQSFLNLGGIAPLLYDSTAVADAAMLTQFAADMRASGSAVGVWTIYTAARADELRRLGCGWFISDIPLDRSALGSIAAPAP